MIRMDRMGSLFWLFFVYTSGYRTLQLRLSRQSPLQRERLVLEGHTERDGGSSVAVSKIERLVSQLKGQLESKALERSSLQLETVEKLKSGESVIDKYSDFFATPPAANSTAVLPGSFNQTFYNESKNKADREPNVSMLENRIEVESARQDLLEKLGGLRVGEDNESGVVSDLTEPLQALARVRGTNSESVVQAITKEEPTGGASVEAGDGGAPSVPSLQEAYGDLPRWLIGPLLRFFNTDDLPDERSRELYEIAAVLTLKDSMELEEDLDYDRFQRNVIKRYQDLMKEQIQSSENVSGDNDIGKEIQSIYGTSDPFWASKASTEDLRFELQALIEDLSKLDIDAKERENLMARLVSILVKVDNFVNAVNSRLPVHIGDVSESVSLDEVVGENEAGKGADNRDDDIANALKNILVQVDDDDVETSAERFVKSYFDPASREGLGISREGAGRFQQEILTDLFTVNSVKTCDGAIIFEGQPSSKYKNTFSEILRERVSESAIGGEMGYILIMNEKLVNFEGGFERAALDLLLGSSPAVVVFPKAWNSTISISLEQPFTKFWQNFLSSAAVVSSGIFAGYNFNIFDVDGDFARTGDLPVDFLPLALTPVIIQLLASVTEAVVGGLKDVRVATLTIPTLTLFNFGSRAVYESRPNNRNEMFDIALTGIATALLSSVVLMVYGLVLTKGADASTLADYPTLSVSLLELNAVVSNIFSQQFPAVFTSGDTSKVHLHWLAIAGAVSFIANSLQLLPLDNSAGSKLSYSVIGRDNFDVLNAVANLIKFLVIFPMLFSIGGDSASVITTAGVFSVQRLIIDYIVASQLATGSDVQVAVDNLAEVSEGRKIIFGGLVSLLLYCYFPFDGVRNSFEQLTGSGGAFSHLF